MKKPTNWIGIALAVFISLQFCAAAYGQVDARLLRYPDVSQKHITFVYAGDIWLAPKEGGTAHRLSSPKGEERMPRFSPDGKHIAFTGNYDGNGDVYVMSITGGLPVRVTHHPGDDRIVDWYPNGKSLLFASRMGSYRFVYNQFYKTSPKGGMPEKLPLAYGEFGSFSPDGNTLAFTYLSQDFRSWKRYRGGTAPDVWLYDMKTKKAENITNNDAEDSIPMFHGSTVYFLSNQGPKKRGNIWAYDTKTKKSRQVTKYKDFDVKFPSIGPDDIVFECGGRLYLMALKNEKVREVKIKVVTDHLTLKPRVEKAARYIVGGHISPSGKRAVLEARGEIFTLPQEHGPIHNITRTSGVAERFPSWAPDGKWIAYFSDRSGEYQLNLKKADGSGKEKTLTSLGKGFRFKPQWSPDSKWIVFLDNEQYINLCNVKTKTLTKIDRIDGRLFYDLRAYSVNWSADSNYIAYSRPLVNNNDAIFMYDVKGKKKYQLTTGFYNEFNPVFDPKGDYLYFFSYRSFRPIYSDLQPTWIYPNTTRIVALTLRKDVPSPLAPRNDVEKGEEGDKDKKGDIKKGKKGDKKGGKKGDKKGDKKKGPKPLKIDFDGLSDRYVVLPPKAGNYRFLSAVPGKVIYIRYPRSGSGSRTPSIVYYDLKEREEKTIIEGPNRYFLSAGHKKMLVRKGRDYAVIGVKPKQKMKKRLRVNEMEMTVHPMEEWKQLFADSWRYFRDFFYDKNLHGRDWNLMRKRYGKLLEDAVTRWDVDFVLGELVGEVSAGHVFRFGGQMESAKRRGVGMLGVDFELHQGAYRIKDIIDVSSQNIEHRSPLRRPGVKIKEGDYILAVNGVDIDTSKDPWAAFQGLAKKTVILTVNSKPTRQGARDILVKTLSSEFKVRELAWVEANRRKVEKATNNRVGYIYVPNTSLSGQTELVRQFRAQHAKHGLIVDERFNTGGQLGDRFVELFNRPVNNYFYFREGRPWRNPEVTNIGPKAMLQNGWSGSGGDAFPYYFQNYKIGPVIGTRTWGGLVGPSYPLPLIDGGYVSPPPARIVGTDGKWTIENIGVIPDILLVNNPAKLAAGEDQQLNRAIKYIMDELKKNPPKPPKMPKINQ